MALKFVTKNKTKLRSFVREYSLTGSLSCSPFIIKVLDVLFETEDSYVFGQEYAPAGDLFDIIPPQVSDRSSSHQSAPCSNRAVSQVLLGSEPALFSRVSLGQNSPFTLVLFHLMRWVLDFKALLKSRYKWLQRNSKLHSTVSFQFLLSFSISTVL